MIGKLKGIVDGYGEDFVILDVGGVGYQVHCSTRTLHELPATGEHAVLAIETYVREDQIRLAQRPVALQRHGRRRLLRIAFRIAARRPGQDLVDFGRTDRRRVLEADDTVPRMPWRHVPGNQLHAERFAPRKCILVCHQRHRRHPVLNVAAAATVTKDRKDIVVVGVRGCDRLVGFAAFHTERDSAEDCHDEQDSPLAVRHRQRAG